jgi:hypothetical protein
VIYDGFQTGGEYWRMRVDDLRKDKENVWLIGVWFFTEEDVSAAFPQSR